MPAPLPGCAMHPAAAGRRCRRFSAAGELSYESDAAERLRSELRAMQVGLANALLAHEGGREAAAALLLVVLHQRGFCGKCAAAQAGGSTETAAVCSLRSMQPVFSCADHSSMQAEAHSLRNELDGAKLQHLRLQEAAAAAEAAAEAAQRQLEAQRDGEGMLQVGPCLRGAACTADSADAAWVEHRGWSCSSAVVPTAEGFQASRAHARRPGYCRHVLTSPFFGAPALWPVLQAEALSLRRALAEAQRKLHALSTDTGSMIDRRIVVKMLITYFEKDYSCERLPQ